MTATEKRARLWDNARTLHGNLKALGFRLGTENPTARSSQ